MVLFFLFYLRIDFQASKMKANDGGEENETCSTAAKMLRLILVLLNFFLINFNFDPILSCKIRTNLRHVNYISWFLLVRLSVGIYRLQKKLLFPCF